MLEFLKRNNRKIVAPISGEIMKITEVPDHVFSEKMVGDGVAIQPKDGLVVAPCDGTVVQIFPTNHAIGIRTKDGIEILIHLGIDTVELKGEGFQRIIEEGQSVKKGDPLIRMDLETIEGNHKSTISPVIITNMEMVKKMVPASGMAQAGADSIITFQIR